MKQTLQQLLIECLRDINTNKNDLDPLKYPSQILCLAEAIEFTKNCEKAIKTNHLTGYLRDLKGIILSFSNEVGYTHFFYAVCVRSIVSINQSLPKTKRNLKEIA